MAVTLHFNPSTLRTIYNPATKRVQVVLRCPDHCLDPETGECIKSETNSPCWGDGDTPAKICIVASGILKCSDDSLWEGNHVICLDGPIENSGYEYVWYKTVVINEETITFAYLQNEVGGDITSAEFVISVGNLGTFSPIFLSW